MKILVADDSNTNLALISSALQSLGHEVIQAQDGFAAVELFKKTAPDLIILDVMMEGRDGFETAKRIRALEKEKDDWIPIIFLSASVDDASIAKGIDAGGDDYLTKPFSEITLSAKIKSMQRIANMRKSLYEASKKLALLSATDTLTGIYNRLQFNKTIQEKIAEADRRHSFFALLFLDLDQFKEVNDVYGHPIGDLLLIEASKRLQACLRLHDFLCRMGGDEFAIILSDLEEAKAASLVAQKIIQSLSSPYHLDKHTIHCSCSIGIVFCPEDGMDAERLFQHADLAMYQAKKLGKNNFQYYHGALEMHDKAAPPLELEDSKNLSAPLNASDPSLQGKGIQVLRCLVHRTELCIDLRYVTKNLLLPQLVPLPNSPPYVLGLMNYRGKSIPVVDLGERLGMKRDRPYTLDTPVLLCEDGAGQIGFVVDTIFGLYEISPQDFQKEAVAQPMPYFLATITINGALSLLVNMSYLLSDPHREDHG